MRGGKFRTDRNILPIGKDVNGDEIDGVIDFAIAQPDLPDIGIGDGNGNLRLDRADRGGKLGSRHISVQQNLIADHKRTDGFRKFPGEANGSRYLPRILLPVPIEENSLDNFQAHLGREFGNLIETMIVRIGTDALGYFGELGEIFRDLLPRHLRCRRQ